VRCELTEPIGSEARALSFRYGSRLSSEVPPRVLPTPSLYTSKRFVGRLASAHRAYHDTGYVHPEGLLVLSRACGVRCNCGRSLISASQHSHTSILTSVHHVCIYISLLIPFIPPGSCSSYSLKRDNAFTATNWASRTQGLVIPNDVYFLGSFPTVHVGGEARCGGRSMSPD